MKRDSIFNCNISDSSFREIEVFKRTILKKLLDKCSTRCIEKEVIESGRAKIMDVHAFSVLNPAFAHLVINTTHDYVFDGFELDYILREIQRLNLNEYDVRFISSEVGNDFGVVATAWPLMSLNNISKRINEDLQLEITLSLGNHLARDGQVLYLEAVELLNSFWPDAGSLSRALINSLVWFSGARFWSSTEPGGFGAIFVNPQKNWSVLNYVETILHESGHLQLMIKETFGKIMNNPLDLASSPLREDPRPLKAVLHAVFVLTRMSEGLFRLSEINYSNATNAMEMSYLNFKRLQDGIVSLEENAKWTTDGISLFKSIQAKEQELSEKFN